MCTIIDPCEQKSLHLVVPEGNREGSENGKKRCRKRSRGTGFGGDLYRHDRIKRIRSENRLASISQLSNRSAFSSLDHQDLWLYDKLFQGCEQTRNMHWSKGPEWPCGGLPLIVDISMIQRHSYYKKSSLAERPAGLQIIRK